MTQFQVTTLEQAEFALGELLELSNGRRPTDKLTWNQVREIRTRIQRVLIAENDEKIRKALTKRNTKQA